VTRQRLVRVVAGVAALAAIALCVAAVSDEWPRVSDAVRTASPGWLLAGLGLAAVAMVLIALGWARCIQAVGGAPPDRGILVAWYFAGELGKYLPGGIWPVVGRGELARRGGMNRQIAYASVVLSLIALYGAAVLPLGVLVLHPRLSDWWRGLAERVLRRPIDIEVPNLATVVRLLLVYLPVWVAVAGCTLAVATALDAGGSPWRLAGATVMAWLVGFAAVPVPAGAGIREIVFVALAGLPAGVGVAVAATARLCFLLVDGVGGAVASARIGLRRPNRGVHSGDEALEEPGTG
jgi:glycosyltransferase 2 family protein